jgi:glycosyltransferase involved in cell wall biosynthesis
VKILEVLTYYQPHISGLTIYVERLNRALVRQGHEVTVLTSQYDPQLPRQETADGVNIQRVPVAFRVSKGVIMPTFGLEATRWSKWADVIHLHLPQFDAPGLALRGRWQKKPVVLTYHSDLQLPPGLFNRLVDKVVLFQNRLAGSLADVVVTYTADFGQHSPYLSSYYGRKLQIIPPPVELTPATPEETAAFRAKHKLEGKQIIGFAARIAAEKGIEVLLNALPRVWEAFPNAHVLHASPPGLGEEAYMAKLAPLFERYKEKYHLLGALRGAELTAFYQNLDCLVMCSLNNTETFGLVQIEAMQSGAPVAACNLPGVRQPVTMTGMGEVTAVGDHDALAEAIINLLRHKERYMRPAAQIAQAFSPDQTAVEYLRLFEELQSGRRPTEPIEPEAYQQLRLMRNQG